MVGNIFQWCSDWYGEDYYKTAPARNPTGPTDGKTRVLRGGSWFYADYTFNYRASFRQHYAPAAGFNFAGFRCVEGR